jgi:FkbM family methyltransferase
MENAKLWGCHAPRGLVRAIIAITETCPNNWFGRRIAFFLRRIAIMYLRDQPVDVVRFGARMRLLPYNNTCEKRVLFTPNFFDLKERTLLSRELPIDGIFVDVGANIGAYSLYASFAVSGAKIIAIEAQPDTFNRLTYNISQNEISNIKALNCAIANRNGEILLFINDRNSGESSIKVCDGGSLRSIKVPAVTLQKIITDEGLSRIDAIKLDIEGAEDIVLQCFFDEAPKYLWPQLILIENSAHRWGFDLLALLEGHGYVERCRLGKNIALKLR